MKLLFSAIGVFFTVGFLGQMQNIWELDNFRDTTLSSGNDAFNEVWGFVQDGEEYAVLGGKYGTYFFRITDEDKLELVTYEVGAFSHWSVVHRDYHDYEGYLYEVCDEGIGTLRIYDLHYLPDSMPIVYDNSSLIIRSHNIFIDKSSGLLYSCLNFSSFGLDAVRVISLQDPVNPTLIYDYNFVTYVHDVFVRNDTAYLNAVDEGLKVVNFSTPTMPIMIGSMEFYQDKGYNHSGWLSEDGKTYVLCDENVALRFKVCDVSDVSDINVVSLDKPPTFENTVPHNVMLKDGLAYFSYYNDGLQIYDVRNPSNPKRIAYYDTYQEEDTGTNIYMGAWGVYALLPSGRILISDRKYGLYLLGYNAPPDINGDNSEHGIYPNPVSDVACFYLDHTFNSEYTIEIYDDQGKFVKVFNGITDHLYMDLSFLSIGTYSYRYYNPTTDVILTRKFVVVK